jgi:predicted aspartyl protease
MKIRLALSAAMLFVVLAAGANAQTCSLAQMASLDMTILPDGRFTVPVSVNGTALQFMVDTAGVFSKLSGTAADALKLERKATGATMYGVGGKIPVQSVKASSFMLGQNEARDFHFIVDDRLNDAASKIDGVLASDMLTLFDIEIDSAHAKFNLFSQDHCPGKVVYWTRAGYAELPFHLSGDNLHSSRDNHIDLAMQLDGHEVSASLDTGSSTTWLRMKSATQIFGLDENSPGMKRVSGEGSNSLPVFERHFESLTMGGLADKDPTILIIADNMENAFRMEHSEKSRDDPIYGMQFEIEDLTLGMSVISRLHVYIAFKEHKLYVTDADTH